MYWYVSIYSEECFLPQYMYPKLNPFNRYRWFPLSILSHLGLEKLCNKSRFSSKVCAHIDIKCYMTCNLLISWRKIWYGFLPNLKSRSDVRHFFAYGFPRKFVAILLVKCLWLLYWLGYLDDKLVCSNPILWFHISNDAVVLRQNMPDPPCKYRVACNMALCDIFGHLYRILYLNILEDHPCCDTILLLDEYFNPFCCISVKIFSSTRCDELVLLLYFSTVVPMVDNLL